MMVKAAKSSTSGAMLPNFPTPRDIAPPTPSSTYPRVKRGEGGVMTRGKGPILRGEGKRGNNNFKKNSLESVHLSEE